MKVDTGDPTACSRTPPRRPSIRETWPPRVHGCSLGKPSGSLPPSSAQGTVPAAAQQPRVALIARHPKRRRASGPSSLPSREAVASSLAITPSLSSPGLWSHHPAVTHLSASCPQDSHDASPSEESALQAGGRTAGWRRGTWQGVGEASCVSGTGVHCRRLLYPGLAYPKGGVCCWVPDSRSEPSKHLLWHWQSCHCRE